ncbi:hypothetical protein QTP88_005720 [Uroleucon formosanum]
MHGTSRTQRYHYWSCKHCPDAFQPRPVFFTSVFICEIISFEADNMRRFMLCTFMVLTDSQLNITLISNIVAYRIQKIWNIYFALTNLAHTSYNLVSIYGGTGTLTHYKQIEDVQIIIFCFISYKCSLFKQLNSGYVYNIIQLFNLQTLNYRRKYSYSKFLVKLLNKDIDDSFIILRRLRTVLPLWRRSTVMKLQI